MNPSDKKTDAIEAGAADTRSVDSPAPDAPENEVPARLPLLPLRDVVVFPYMVIPLFVGRKGSLLAIEKAMEGSRKLFLATQKNPRSDNPGPDDLYAYGTVAEILQLLKLPDGTIKILVEGRTRVKACRFFFDNDYYEVELEKVPEITEPNLELTALQRTVVNQFEHYIKLNRKIPIEIMMVISNTEDPSRLADIITAHLPLNVMTKQEILESTHLKDRLERLAIILNKEIEILALENKIKGRVRGQIEQMQKEYYLREQMKAIQKELGSEDAQSEEVEGYKKKMADAKLPDHAKEVVEKEIAKLERMPQGSAEGTVVRNYLDAVLALPWSVSTVDNKDLAKSEAILEEDHYGLKKVKERILEFLAVRGRVKKMKGPILCLVGPPGVGKTSLGKSVARAMDRKFHRISLGGVRDEAEIRGHRKTYIGAMAGKIMQGLSQVKSSNPVFLLDEVDKLANDFRGDPSSALLEVLDPEQNATFTDHYINIAFDLSDVLFITTANTIFPIPPALQDRMEIIRIAGYTEDEKMAIATQYLVAKQKKENGLEEAKVDFDPAALTFLVREYTREAGVRNLEREIGSVCRKTVRLAASKKKIQSRITPKVVRTLLGVPKFRYGRPERYKLPGLATGLAWTEVGGVTLEIEAVSMRGKGALVLTGHLSEVMQESARAAFGYVRSRAEDLGIEERAFVARDYHINVPEIAVPKDGPSAGITLATAIVSLITERVVKPEFAMTGEVTLSGRVLPIGGVKEKCLAAHALGFTDIILPDDNRRDLEEIPENIKSKLTFHFVDHMDQVLALVLEPKAKVKKAGEAAKAARAKSKTPRGASRAASAR